jgi:hypothetical protein
MPATKIPAVSNPILFVDTIALSDFNPVITVSGTGHARSLVHSMQEMHCAERTTEPPCTSMFIGQAWLHLEQLMQVGSLRLILKTLILLKSPKKAP